MAKKGPEMVVQRSYIKEHSFPYRLYLCHLSNLAAMGQGYYNTELKIYSINVINDLF